MTFLFNPVSCRFHWLISSFSCSQMILHIYLITVCTYFEPGRPWADIIQEINKKSKNSNFLLFTKWLPALDWFTAWITLGIRLRGHFRIKVQKCPEPLPRAGNSTSNWAVQNARPQQQPMTLNSVCQEFCPQGCLPLGVGVYTPWGRHNQWRIQDFPQGVRQLAIIFQFSCRKLHKNERIWTPRGRGDARPWRPIGSANDPPPSGRHYPQGLSLQRYMCLDLGNRVSVKELNHWTYHMCRRMKRGNIKEWKNSTCWLVLVVIVKLWLSVL